MSAEGEQNVRRLVGFLLLISSLGPIQVLGQEEPRSPRFEVASVRPTRLDILKAVAGAQNGGVAKIGKFAHGARVEYIAVKPWELICEAYRIQPAQVAGLDYSKQARFDIIANLPAENTKTEIHLMLRNLLAERFGLVVHREMRERDVEALVVGEGGLKLKSVSPEDFEARAERVPEGVAQVRDSSTSAITTKRVGAAVMRYRMIDNRTADPRIHAELEGYTMADLAQTLTEWNSGRQRLVVDATGVNGRFSFALDLYFSDVQPINRGSDASGEVSDPGGQTLTQSLRSLGLDLAKRKMPVDFLVVDHIADMPTEN
jgi:uncharacterized protein (TIGR03435 family)